MAAAPVSAAQQSGNGRDNSRTPALEEHLLRATYIALGDRARVQATAASAAWKMRSKARMLSSRAQSGSMVRDRTVPQHLQVKITIIVDFAHNSSICARSEPGQIDIARGIVPHSLGIAT
jgi:hypothetical protein